MIMAGKVLQDFAGHGRLLRKSYVVAFGQQITLTFDLSDHPLGRSGHLDWSWD